MYSFNVDFVKVFYLSSTNPTKCSNTLKQFVDKLPTNCLSVLTFWGVGKWVKPINSYTLASISAAEAYSYPCQTSKMSFIRKNSDGLLAIFPVNNFKKCFTQNLSLILLYWHPESQSILKINFQWHISQKYHMKIAPPYNFFTKALLLDY